MVDMTLPFEVYPTARTTVFLGFSDLGYVFRRMDAFRGCFPGSACVLVSDSLLWFGKVTFAPRDFMLIGILSVGFTGKFTPSFWVCQPPFAGVLTSFFWICLSPFLVFKAFSFRVLGVSGAASLVNFIGVFGIRAAFRDFLAFCAFAVAHGSLCHMPLRAAVSGEISGKSEGFCFRFTDNFPCHQAAREG